MDKIKSVISGHKDDHVSSDPHNASSAVHTEGSDSHPIYDQMTGPKNEHTTATEHHPHFSNSPNVQQTHPTTTGTSTTAATTGTSTGLARHEHTATHGPIGSSHPTSQSTTHPTAHSTLDPTSHHTSSALPRPDANPTGKGNLPAGVSEASIKSGVIGFGPGQPQGHAALPIRHPVEANLQPGQVVGGGDRGTVNTTGDKSVQPGAVSREFHNSGTTGHDRPLDNVSGIGTQGSTTQQPFDKSLRQESYTNDTDRSFPLAGGIAAKQAEHTTKHPTEHATTHPTEHTSKHPTEHNSPTHEKATSDQKPGILGGLLGSKKHGEDTTKHPAEHTSTAHEKSTGDQKPGILGGILGSKKHDDDTTKHPTEHAATHPHEHTTKHPTEHTSSTYQEPTTEKKPGILGAIFGGKEKHPTEDTTTHPVQHGSVHPADPSLSTHQEPTGEKKSGVLGGIFSSGSKHPTENTSSVPHKDPVGRDVRSDGVPSSHPGGYTATTHNKDLGEHEPGIVAGAVPPRHPDHTATTHSATLGDRDPGFIAGSVPSRHPDHNTATHHGATGEREPGILGGAVPSRHPEHTTTTHQEPTKEKKSGILGAIFGSKEKHPTEDTTSHRATGEREPGIKGVEVGAREGHGREGLAGAAAAATSVGVAAPLLHSSDKRDIPVQGQDTRHGTHRDQLPATTHTGTTTGPVKHDHHPEALAAATAAASHSSHLPLSAQGQAHGNHGSTFTDAPRANDTTTTSGNQHSSGALAGALASARPSGHHNDSFRHVPGGFPAATPDESKTFLDYRRDIDPTSVTDVPSNQHELRHTGTLEQPRPRSSDLTDAHHHGDIVDHHHGDLVDDHHHGRDAAIAGGIGASAAGLATHATPQKRQTPVVSGDTLQETSPYSSKQLDPRVNPSAKTETIPHHALQTSNPSGISATSAPTRQEDPQHHHGHDDPLLGVTPARDGGSRNIVQRNDSAATGSMLLPPERSTNPSAPLASRDTPASHGSSIPVSQQPHHSAQPASHGSFAPQQSSRSSEPTFFGTSGAPAPIVDKHSHQLSTANAPSSTSGSSAPLAQRDDPQHHYGRDAAVVGGAGAAGYGAYEAAKAYGDHRSTKPGASMEGQRYDTTASGAHAPNSVPTHGQYDYNDDHTKRNAALGTGAAVGAGGLGAAAHEHAKHADNTHHVPSSQGQSSTSPTYPASVTQSQPMHGMLAQKPQDPYSATQPTAGTIAPHNTNDPTHQHYDPNQDTSKHDHSKRNAAVLGTAGAATAGGAAYAYSQQQDQEREMQRLEKEQQDRLKKEQHAHDKEQHALDKEHAKQEKEAHKLEKEQHKHAKAVAAHEKDQHKLEKQHEKEEKHAEKDARKHANDHETEEKDKKHGLLGFLHRDKSKKEKSTSSPDSSPRQSRDSPRNSKEYAAGTTAAAAAAGIPGYAGHDDGLDAEGHSKWKGKNLLHKDPPPGHPAREALEHQYQGQDEFTGGRREHTGMGGPIGDPNMRSGGVETRTNTHGAHPISDTTNQQRVIEPHTGLPMNVAKYGDGKGGTDANPTVSGYHQVPGQTGGLASPQGGVSGGGASDWNAIKKGDTTY